MSRPTVIVLARSDIWSAAIRRAFSTANLSWVLDTNSLVDESLSSAGAAAIVEICEPTVEADCLGLAQLANNSTNLKLFGVGNHAVLNWQRLLRSAGFAGWYGSLLQVPELRRAVEKHHRSVPPRTQSIESRIWQDLPWPTAATKRHA